MPAHDNEVLEEGDNGSDAASHRSDARSHVSDAKSHTSDVRSHRSDARSHHSDEQLIDDHEAGQNDEILAAEEDDTIRDHRTVEDEMDAHPGGVT